MGTDPLTSAEPSLAALRMRRSRERRQRSCALITLELLQSAIAERLVALGWLPSSKCCDTGALARALSGLIAGAIETWVTPATGLEGRISFTYHLTARSIEMLVQCGWLEADERQAHAAVVNAFCSFAARAVDVARNGGPGRWYFP